MSDLTNPDTIQNIFKKHNFAPNKFLGQNFLIDKKVLDKIIAAADIKEGGNVIEIGPGLGVLTQALLAKGANVAAIEKDKDLILALEENLREFKSLKIINDDFLRVDFEKLISDFGGKPYKIVSNIPYYITSPVLRKILSAEIKPQEMVFLVQREVAERISAKPGQMSFISVFVQFYGAPIVAGVVKPESFWPAPKVDSAILKIVLGAPPHPMNIATDKQDPEMLIGRGGKKPAPEGWELKEFWRLVKIGFSSRRKTLANNLAAGFSASGGSAGGGHIPREKIKEILKSLGFGDKTRAQELSVEDWLRLAKKLFV